jgi:hypothetical protein
MKFEIENEIDEILNQDYSAQETIIYSGAPYDDGLDEQFYAEGDAPAQAPAGNPAQATATKTGIKVDAGMGDMGDMGNMGGMDDLGGMGGGMGDMGGFGGGMGGGMGGYGDQPQEDVEPLPGEDSEDIGKKLVIFRQYRRLKEILKHLSDTIEEANKKIHVMESRNLLSKMDSEITTTLEQIDFIIAEDFRKKDIGDSEREYKSMEEKSKLIARSIQNIINRAKRGEKDAR